MNTQELFEAMSNIEVGEIFIHEAFINFKQDRECFLQLKQELYEVEV